MRTAKEALEMTVLGIECGLVAQMVKSLPAMREAWVQSLGQEDRIRIMVTDSQICWD